MCACRKVSNQFGLLQDDTNDNKDDKEIGLEQIISKELMQHYAKAAEANTNEVMHRHAQIEYLK